jgi:hypothetical protein
MHRRSGLALGGLCALGFIAGPGAALAQDGGVSLVFGLENRLEAVRNDSLSVPADGTDISNVTRLSFGLTSETAIDRLAFTASGALIAESLSAGSGTDFRFGREAANLTYHREVPAAVLDLQADFRRDDVDAIDADLTQTGTAGTQANYLASAGLEIGRTSTIGFAFGLAYEAVDYQDTIDPDLNDSTEARGDIAMLLHLSDVTTGRVGLRYSHREEETLGTRTVDTTVGYVGLDTALSQKLDLSAELGYTRTRDEEFDVIDRTTGPDLRLGLTYDMPVGTAMAALRVTTDADEGQRETFEIGRDLETPTATISARLGVTHADISGSDVIGRLEWTRRLPDGSLGVALERNVSYDTADAQTVTASALRVNYTRTISDLSSISLAISYQLSESVTEDIDQVTLGAGYTHRLTNDWSLNSGIGYRIRNDNDGHSESPNLFVSLSRDFQLRP